MNTSSKTQNAELALYGAVVEAHLGKRAAVVISTLINYGRLNVRELAKRASLSPSIVKKTLVSLIQLKCVSVWDEENYKGKNTYYSFREEGVLLILYSGEITQHIEETYNNDKLTQIIQNFLSLGNLSISEYLTSFQCQDAEEVAKLELLFHTLVTDKYLVVVQKSHFSPLKDIWLKTFENALTRVPRTATTSELKRTAEAKALAKTEFLNLLNYVPANLFVKDKVTMTTKVNPTLPLTFNLQRFLKARRTAQLKQLCSHRAGKITSIIFKAALELGERTSPDVLDPIMNIGLTNEEILNYHDMEPSPSAMFSAKDVMKKLPKTLKLKDTILMGPPKRKQDGAETSSRKRVKLDPDSFGIPGHIEDDEDDEDELINGDNTTAMVDHHLKILAANAIPFLKKSNSLYYIPYKELLTYLKRFVADQVVSTTLGGASSRIMRCIRDNRLVSEKLINSVALLKEKDGRSLTSVLVKHNLIQIQEVPKSADRAASKSVFLYRISDKHYTDTLKTNVCWNMGRLVEKVLLLKLENAGLISKINRDDVKGKELEYLLPSELTQLKTLKEKELNLTVKVHRLIALWEVFKFY